MLTPFQKRKLARKFHLFDHRRSGRIRWRDIQRVLDNVIEVSEDVMSPAERSELLLQGHTGWLLLAAAADVNQDGEVDLEEWYAFYDSVIYDDSDTGAVPGWLVDLEDRSFRLMDANGDDLISFAEYRALLGAYGIEEDLSESFRHIDTDGDGFISRSEWRELNEAFYLGRDPLAASAWLWGDIYKVFFK